MHNHALFRSRLPRCWAPSWHSWRSYDRKWRICQPWPLLARCNASAKSRVAVDRSRALPMASGVFQTNISQSGEFSQGHVYALWIEAVKAAQYPLGFEQHGLPIHTASVCINEAARAACLGPSRVRKRIRTLVSTAITTLLYRLCDRLVHLLWCFRLSAVLQATEHFFKLGRLERFQGSQQHSTLVLRRRIPHLAATCGHRVRIWAGLLVLSKRAWLLPS